MHTHTYIIHALCHWIIRYQPCTYEIVVNRLAFNSKYLLKLFCLFLGEEVWDFSVNFYCFWLASYPRARVKTRGANPHGTRGGVVNHKRLGTRLNILPHLFHCMTECSGIFATSSLNLYWEQHLIEILKTNKWQVSKFLRRLLRRED